MNIEKHVTKMWYLSKTVKTELSIVCVYIYIHIFKRQHISYTTLRNYQMYQYINLLIKYTYVYSMYAKYKTSHMCCIHTIYSIYYV